MRTFSAVVSTYHERISKKQKNNNMEIYHRLTSLGYNNINWIREYLQLTDDKNKFSYTFSYILFFVSDL